MNIIKGFLFGTTLQIAVGPVCIFVFNTSVSSGFLTGLAAVAAVTLADLIYILAALGGAAALFSGKREMLVRIVSACILIAFGLYMIVSTVIIGDGAGEMKTASSAWAAFIAAGIITAGNPLTIVFWAGVFGSRISTGTMSKKGIMLFSLGCIISTPFWLSIVSGIGFAMNHFVPIIAITVLNIVAGCVISAYGCIMIKKAVRR